MSETPVLEVRNLTVGLPAGGDRQNAVQGIDLTVNPREIVCLVGESGSGKSVTAFATMGLLPKALKPTGGQILLQGEDILAAGEERLRELRCTRMSMIFQEPMTALNPVMTCGEQIDEVLETHTKLDPAERKARILAMLEQVRLPDPPRMYESYPHQLSGGQRQRIMIAMALVLEPALLIADEPTTALDVTTQAQILQLIKELQATHGTGVLFITHDFGVVAEIAHRVAVLRYGELVEMGPTEQLLKRPQHPYTKMLMAAVPSIHPRHREDRSSQTVVLRAEGLSKVYAGGGFFQKARPVRAADNVTIEVRRGETLGIVGESGSGKSTLARCIVRLIDPDQGAVELGGTDLAHLSRAEMRQQTRHIQMVFQDPFASLNPRRRAGDLVAQGPMVHGASRADALARARELFQLVGLDPVSVDRFPHEFSGGQRQRIGLARALALEPEVLVADEPVSALDVSVQAQVLALLADLRARLGISMVFITHDLRVAAQICDLVAVMKDGEVVEEGPVGRVFGDPQHPYTRALLDSIPGRGFGAGA